MNDVVSENLDVLPSEKVVPMNNQFSPNAILGMLLSKVNAIESLGVVVKWKNGEGPPGGDYSTVFDDGCLFERAALFCNLLTHYFTTRYISGGPSVEAQKQ